MSDPLIALARSIASEAGRPVPTPDPAGPTTRALALLVLRDPGATPEGGANATGVLNPYLNADGTSLRQRKRLAEAGIDPACCVWWNACPYHVGKVPFSDTDRARGKRYLRQVLDLCPDLRVVVAMGNEAHDVCVLAGLRRSGRPPLIATAHPLIRGRNYDERLAELRRDLDEAARLIAGRS